MASIKNNTNHVDPSLPDDARMQMNGRTRNITVEVSGSRFCIVPSLFKHIENLPWKKRKNNNLKLNANPDVFESVLQFFLSSKLPDPTSLSSRRAKTLIEFVSPLDPVAVKPLVNYLQTFVTDRSSSDKNSFMRRSLTTISSPFSPRGPRSKSSKPPTSADHSANQGASHTIGNSNNAKSSNNHGCNRMDLGANAPVVAASPIPTHIEHPVAASTAIAEISVCSMDESSVSKLSLQSSPSLVTTTQPTVPRNENSMAVSTSSSVASAHHQIHHIQNQFQHYYQQNSLGFDGSSNAGGNRSRYPQQTGFSADSHVQRENNFAAPTEYRNEYLALAQSPQRTFIRTSNENYPQYRSQTVVQANNAVPFTQTQNFVTGVNRDIGETNDPVIQKDSSTSHRQSGSTKIIRKLGRKEKKYVGTGNNGSRNLFRKQEKMTHAEWCASASEYIV